MPRPRKYTDAEFRAAVETASTWLQVCRILGVNAGGATYRSFRKHAAALDVSDTHPPAQGTRPRGRGGGRVNWTDDDLSRAVSESTTMAEVIRRLGYAANGGNHRWIQAHIRRLGLATSHFKGQGWAKGTSFGDRRQTPLAEILVENSTYSASSLRKRLLRAGLKEARCEGCGLTHWRGVRIRLHLHHVNGVHTDNRLENLRILCPNCHSVEDRTVAVAQPA